MVCLSEDTEVKGQLLIGDSSEIEACLIHYFPDCFNCLVLHIPFLAPLAHGTGSQLLRGFWGRCIGGWAKGDASLASENMFMILLVYPLKLFDCRQQKQILPKAKKEREEEQKADQRTEGKAGFVGLGRFREWHRYAVSSENHLLPDWTPVWLSLRSRLRSREKGLALLQFQAPWVRCKWESCPLKQSMLDRDGFPGEIRMFLPDYEVTLSWKDGSVVFAQGHLLCRQSEHVQPKFSVAQGQTLNWVLGFLPVFPHVASLGLGIIQTQMVFVFLRAPAIQSLTYATLESHEKEARWQIGTNYSQTSVCIQIPVTRSLKHPIISSTEITPGEVRLFNLFAAQQLLNSQPQIPSLQSNAPFGPIWAPTFRALQYLG